MSCSFSVLVNLFPFFREVAKTFFEKSHKISENVGYRGQPTKDIFGFWTGPNSEI